MQQYIMELKYSTPPWSGPIDIEQPAWISTTLSVLLDKMLQIALTQSEGHSLRRVFEELTYVVVNYRSLRTSGWLGQRHAITLGNASKMNLPASPAGASEIRDGTDQIEIHFYRSGPGARTARFLAAPNLRASWLAGWSDYLRLGPDSETAPTLGWLHLGSAPRPRPLFVSWFESESASQYGQVGPGITLTPISINVPPKNVPPHGSAADAIGFHDFMNRFQTMFEGLDPVPNEKGTYVLDRLHQFFGPSWGSKSFFSVPVAIGVLDKASHPDEIHQLRAVISVGMSAEWDEGLYRTAWEFFSGVASQVLTDILVTELVQHTRKQLRKSWESDRTRTSYVIAHPLKNRLGPVASLSSVLFNKLYDFSEEFRENAMDSDARLRPGIPKELESLVANAQMLNRRAHEASAYSNLLHLMADLHQVEEADSLVRTSIQRAPPGLLSPEQSIDLGKALREAATLALDKTLSGQSVRLSGDFEHRIARRLQEAPLNRHSNVEEDFYAAIFLELLDNAASYGRCDRDGEVRVDVTWQRDSKGHHILSLTNAIAKDFVRGALQCRNGELLHGQVVSGIILASNMLRRLHLGRLSYTVSELSADEPEEDRYKWSYVLQLEPR